MCPLVTAEGFEDSAIAVYLRVEKGKLDSHIDSMYGKLGLIEREGCDRRVQAVQVFVGHINSLNSESGNEPNHAALIHVQTPQNRLDDWRQTI